MVHTINTISRWLRIVHKSWATFISSFYKVVFMLAKCIPHDCERQDDLIKALLELRKLPSRQTKIRGVYICYYPTPPTH